jgi:hypothetical protein
MKQRTQYEGTPHVYVGKLGMSTIYYPADTPTIVHFIPHSHSPHVLSLCDAVLPIREECQI